jgi:hypothetical protein
VFGFAHMVISKSHKQPHFHGHGGGGGGGDGVFFRILD